MHVTDLQAYGAQTEGDRIQARIVRQYLEEKLAENLIANAEQTEDGEFLLQGVPVPPENALAVAQEDIRYFDKTDTHLSPKQIQARLMQLEKVAEQAEALDHNIGTSKFQTSRELNVNSAYQATESDIQPIAIVASNHKGGKIRVSRPSVRERLKQGKSTFGAYKPMIRAAVQIEKALARRFPDNPNLIRGRLANSASEVKAGLRYNSNDIPLTHAGHALEKHGNRNLPNSVFPSFSGNNTQKNRLGQEIVEDILFDEATKIKRHSNFNKNRYPNVVEMIDITSDFGTGPGLRYNLTKNGKIEFNTFLEP